MPEKQGGAGGDTSPSLARGQPGSFRTCGGSDTALGRLVGNELGFPGCRGRNVQLPAPTEASSLQSVVPRVPEESHSPFSTSAVLQTQPRSPQLPRPATKW